MSKIENNPTETIDLEKDIGKVLRGIPDETPASRPIFSGLPRDPLSTSSTPYGHLERILKLAFDQSANGKGKDRHATGPTGFKPWDRQPILEISRMVGPGYAAGQVAKKVQESVTMHGNKNLSGAKAEALGAIVYAAALYKLYEEIENG